MRRRLAPTGSTVRVKLEGRRPMGRRSDRPTSPARRYRRTMAEPHSLVRTKKMETPKMRKGVFSSRRANRR